MASLVSLPRNFGDPRPDFGVFSSQAYFVETGAGTYNANFFLPANALILMLWAYAHALWTAATSASLVCGDYTDAGVAIDADGFIAATDLKATDLLAGQSITLLGAGQGGKAGAYNSGTNTHWDQVSSLNDRYIRFTVTSVGAGTGGRTRVGLSYILPISITTTTV